MSVAQEIFFVFGEHGKLRCKLSTGVVLNYEPEGSQTFDYADITRVDAETYEQEFRHRISAGDRIDIVHFNYWTTLGEYHRRTPMTTDPKPVDAAKQVTDYLRAEDQAMLDVAWQEAVDARKADQKPLDIREQLWKIAGEEQAKDYKEDDKKFIKHLKSLSSKEISDRYMEKWRATVEEVDHTGHITVGDFLQLAASFAIRMVSLDYDFSRQCWVLTASQFKNHLSIHRITFPQQTWLNDKMQEHQINNCIKAMGLHPTTDVCSKSEVLDFLGFGEVFCTHKGTVANA